MPQVNMLEHAVSAAAHVERVDLVHDVAAADVAAATRGLSEYIHVVPRATANEIKAWNYEACQGVQLLCTSWPSLSSASLHGLASCKPGQSCTPWIASCNHLAR